MRQYRSASSWGAAGAVAGPIARLRGHRPDRSGPVRSGGGGDLCEQKMAFGGGVVYAAGGNEGDAGEGGGF